VEKSKIEGAMEYPEIPRVYRAVEPELERRWRDTAEVLGKLLAPHVTLNAKSAAFEMLALRRKPRTAAQRAIMKEL
jgi:hypothetical protein